VLKQVRTRRILQPVHVPTLRSAGPGGRPGASPGGRPPGTPRCASRPDWGGHRSITWPEGPNAPRGPRGRRGRPGRRSRL
jgi:hypothetical protein